jgi:protein-tyrosine-phosphatase
MRSAPLPVPANQPHDARRLRFPSVSPAQRIDVSGVVVSPSFRTSDSFNAAKAAAASRTPACPLRVLFLSEGNVCRSVLAEALLRDRLATLAAAGCSLAVQVESKGTRDYNVGEGPEPAAALAAAHLGLQLRPHSARVSDVAADVVLFDLLLTFDKFTAADVMREVSVYDTVDPAGRYAPKVRSLTQFHPGLLDEVGDPLYGACDSTGAAEVAATLAAARVIGVCVDGLVAELQAAAAKPEGLRAALQARLDELSPIEWLAPPMLSPRT